MSASTAKASRRDLRRALGPMALDTLASHATAIADLRDATEKLASSVLKMRGADQDHLADALIQIQDKAHADFHRPTFRARLNWLFTGR